MPGFILLLGHSVLFVFFFVFVFSACGICFKVMT